MPSAQPQHKIFSFDLIRAVAIILVVLDHSNLLRQPYKSLSSIFLAPDAVLFLALSGALLLPVKGGYGHFLVKRIKRVVIPYLIWGAVFILTLYLVTGFNTQGALYMARWYWLTPYAGPYWFIFVIVSCYFMLPIISPWLQQASRRHIEYFLIIWLIAGTAEWLTIFMGMNETINYFTAIPTYLGYFILGYYLTRFPLFRAPSLPSPNQSKNCPTNPLACGNQTCPSNPADATWDHKPLACGTTPGEAGPTNPADATWDHKPLACGNNSGEAGQTQPSDNHNPLACGTIPGEAGKTQPTDNMKPLACRNESRRRAIFLTITLGAGILLPLFLLIHPLKSFPVDLCTSNTGFTNYALTALYFALLLALGTPRTSHTTTPADSPRHLHPFRSLVEIISRNAYGIYLTHVPVGIIIKQYFPAIDAHCLFPALFLAPLALSILLGNLPLLGPHLR